MPNKQFKICHKSIHFSTHSRNTPDTRGGGGLKEEHIGDHRGSYKMDRLQADLHTEMFQLHGQDMTIAPSAQTKVQSRLLASHFSSYDFSHEVRDGPRFLTFCLHM